MVVIPAGSYLMGAPEGEPDRSAQETPRHQVTISRPFALGIYEVTVGEFEAFVRETGYDAGSTCQGFEGDVFKTHDGRNWRQPGYKQNPRHPVVCVSWRDAKAYVRWLSRKTGQAYRLLSEAEWEYAARAGTTTAYWWGPSIGLGRTNCNGCGSLWSGKLTAPVGTYEPNTLGLHDMLGNAREWVEDCWNTNYHGAPTDGRAWTTGNCGGRVLRGGSWGLVTRYVRAASRDGNVPDFRHDNDGFRVAKTLQ